MCSKKDVRRWRRYSDLKNAIMPYIITEHRDRVAKLLADFFGV